MTVIGLADCAGYVQGAAASSAAWPPVQQNISVRLKVGLIKVIINQVRIGKSV